MYFSECAGTSYLGDEQEPLLPSNSPRSVSVPNVEFVDLNPGKVFYKKQYRKNHWPESRQLVKDGGHGLICMRATTNCQLIRILGWVKRENHAAILVKDSNGEVPIKNEETGEQINLIKTTDNPTLTEDGYALQPFSVDLHGIFKGNPNCKPAFELCRSDSENKKNLFQLVIRLEYIDGSKSQAFVSPAFNLRTEESRRTKEETAAKRKRVDNRVDSNSISSPASVASEDSGTFTESMRYQEILVDMLDAKTAKIGKLVVHDFQAGTTRADLAYHMRLRDPENYNDLEEGDIVGFYKDESGETYIERLRGNNIHNALHAGVVSRSYWMAGHKPQNPETKTDTICVIGIVNVKVVGSVENGERIYASTTDPGKAIPQSHMPVGSFLRKKHVLLGMALETKKCTKALDEAHLVKCFVCIVLDVSRQEMFEEIEDLYQVNEKRTEEQIRISNKRNWRRLKGCFLSTLVILGVLIVLLYQWLVPGSMFRYWLCRLGCVPNHHLYFKYFDKQAVKDFTIHGIEFHYERLKEKIGEDIPRNANATIIRYYLNVDRCAYYWADGAAGNNIGGRKYIGGSVIFSVNETCKEVYEWKEGSNNWTKIDLNDPEAPDCRDQT